MKDAPVAERNLALGRVFNCNSAAPFLIVGSPAMQGTRGLCGAEIPVSTTGI